MCCHFCLNNGLRLLVCFPQASGLAVVGGQQLKQKILIALMNIFFLALHLYMQFTFALSQASEIKDVYGAILGRLNCNIQYM